MSFFAFLSDRLTRLVLRSAVMAGAALILLATGTRPGVVALLLAILLPAAVLSLAADYLKSWARLEELEAVWKGLDQKYLFAECAPPARSVYERQLFCLLRRSGKAMIEAVSQAQAAQREYREYVERWVHEIKTPITAAGLICREAAPGTRQRLAPELGRIEAHVERALFYARAETPEKDFLIRRVRLSDIAAQTLQAHKALLLQSGVRVDTEGLETEVCTDEKWAAFILGQLLQNAARYRGEAPVVTLSARSLGGQVRLTVRDNGIGIPAHELPRIFDRGFTGSNGRLRGGSTGMGLYLCRRLAESLELDLRITSEEGSGTSADLTFPCRENLSKL